MMDLDSTTFETMRVERQDRALIIRLHRPEAANAMNARMAGELADVAAEADADPNVRAVLLTASGRFFCAGGDVLEMTAMGERRQQQVKRLADDLHRAIAVLARMRAPLVVAVNGVAAGAGFSLAMVGDMVLAAQSARFTMAYTSVGLSPDGSSTYFLPRLIGLRRTQALMFTNRQLSAEEALNWNLIHEVAPDADLERRALELTHQLARGPVAAHAAIKRLLQCTYGNGLETQMELEGRAIAERAASVDGDEGLRAFAEKRPPRFG